MAFHWLLDPFWAYRVSSVKKTCTLRPRNESTKWIHDRQAMTKCYFYSNLIIHSFDFWPSFFLTFLYKWIKQFLLCNGSIIMGLQRLCIYQNWIKNVMPIFDLKFHGHPLSLDQKHLNKLNVELLKKKCFKILVRIFSKISFPVIGKISLTNSRFSKDVEMKHSTLNLKAPISRVRLWKSTQPNILYILLSSDILTWWEMTLILLPTWNRRWLEYCISRKQKD